MTAVPDPSREALWVDGPGLRRLREAADLTQAVLAARVGVSTSRVQRIEAARLEPGAGPDRLREIARSLERGHLRRMALASAAARRGGTAGARRR